MGRPKTYPDTPEGQAAKAASKKASIKRAKARYYAKPENKAKRNEDIKRYRATEEGKAKAAELAKRYASTAEGRKAIQEGHRRRCEDPAYKLRYTLRSRLDKVLRAIGKKGRYHSVSKLAVESLGCTLDEFRDYIEDQFLPGMTWANHVQVWHLDHRKALGLFDLNDPAEVRAAGHFTNLQPLFAEEHVEKTRRDRELMREKGRAYGDVASAG